MVDAQQARRVLDRIVGYKISPLLWKKVKKGLSAGRVQSVAVKLICDREEEIENFKPEEYWNIYANLKKKKDKKVFQAKFYGKNDEKIDIHSPLHTVVEKLFSQKAQNKNTVSENNSNNNNDKSNIEYLNAKSQYRIFSCNKSIHELNTIRSFYENEIQDGELLLYLPIQELSFSSYIKGNSVLISQKNKIASKVNTDLPQYALGDEYYSFGKHYFEINLLTLPIETSIIIGVATKKNQKDKFSYDVNGFYGIIASNMCLIWMEKGKQYKKELNKNKKDSFNINDIVGVLLEFKKEGLQISFYKNKMLLGSPYKNIPDNFFYPAVSLGIVGSKVQISNLIDYP